MQADAEKDVLLQRLDVLLQLESRNRNARGYFLTQIFEKNVQGHKFEVNSLPCFHFNPLSHACTRERHTGLFSRIIREPELR